jgi:iron complex outermembrane receptor protein
MTIFMHLLVLALILASSALAPASAAPGGSKTEVSVPEITVLGIGDGSRTSVQDFVPTVDELSGRKLDKKKQSTLGETLARETGVSSTQYGPNASRPVIRGLEGERVRILQGGIGTLDASATSADHAVAGDPMVIDRVEIIRGSAALLYGSSAIGGVVNTVSSRIPTRLKYDTSLKFDSRISSVDAGRSFGLLANSSTGSWAWHIDSIYRDSSEYRTPVGKISNSQNQTFEGALGLSRVTETGYWGAAYSTFNTDYGVVKETDVTIDMARQRLDLAGEFKGSGWLEAGRLAGAISSYTHEEMEGSEVGTTFNNRGSEFRADLKHRRLGALQGVLGAQVQSFTLSADGDEAFLPTSNTFQAALFGYEELRLGAWTPNFGLRGEFSALTPDEAVIVGAVRERSFITPSLSAGTLYQLDSTYSLGLNTSYTVRAPNSQELYADGPHMATSVYEQGDPQLKPEIGRAVELSLRRKTESSEGRATLFAQDFIRFLSLTPTGGTDPGSTLPIHEFRPISALLVGVELESRTRLPWKLWDGIWELEARLDLVRGLDRSNETQLPRMTPMRETVALGYRGNSFSGELELSRAEAQGFLAPNETRTPAYTLVNLGGEMPLGTGFGALRLTARLNNVLNAEARNHVSFVKDIAPLAGRNFIFGLQARM